MLTIRTERRSVVVVAHNAAFWITAKAAKTLFAIKTGMVLYEYRVEALNIEGIDNAWIQDEDEGITTLYVKIENHPSPASVLANYLLVVFGSGRWVAGGDRDLLEEVSMYARDLADEQHSVLIV